MKLFGALHVFASVLAGRYFTTSEGLFLEAEGQKIRITDFLSSIKIYDFYIDGVYQDDAFREALIDFINEKKNGQ